MKNKIIEKLEENNLKFISVITTLFMLMSHGYVYFNQIFSHDSMKIIYWGEWLMYDTVEIGRYMIPLYLLIRGKYYPPFLIGILSIIFMILLIYYLVKIFDIKNKINIALLAGILSTSCTITLLNATYIEYSDMYILSFLLTIISVYLLLKSKIKFRIPLSVLLLIISLGIYQTSLPIFVSLIIIYSIIEIIKKKDLKTTLKSFSINMIFGVIASGIYFGIYKLILKIFNIKPSTCYNSLNEVAKYESIKDMIKMIINQYKTTYDFIIHPSTYYKTLSIIINAILVILVLLFFIVILFNRKNKYSIIKRLLVITLLVIITFVVNCTYFLSNGVIHQLMIFPMFLLYLIPIIILDKSQDDNIKEFDCIKNVTKKAYKYIAVGFALLIVSSIIYSNQVYQKKQMEFESTKLTMNRIVQNIENIEGYEIDKTPIVFIGYLSDGPLSFEKSDLDYESVGLQGKYSLTYYLNYKQFLNNYMGYPVKVLSEDKSKEFSEKEEVKNMKPFPSKESYKIVDNVLVIKLSN